MNKSINKSRFTSISADLISGYYVHPKGLVVYEYNPYMDWLYLTTVVNEREHNKMIEKAYYPTPRQVCNICRKFINEI